MTSYGEPVKIGMPGEVGVSMLAALGFDPDEERIYRLLVRTPSSTVDAIAVELGHDRADAERVLNRLEVHGLISRPIGNSEAIVAVSPELALKGAIAANQAALRRAEAEVVALTTEYRGMLTSRSATDVVDLVSGTPAVMRRLMQLLDSAETEVLNLVKPPIMLDTTEFTAAEAAVIERGVRFRVIVETGMLPASGLGYTDGPDDLGEDTRVAPRVPTKLVVVDRAFALLPVGVLPDQRGALIIHESELLDTILTMFELLWAVSTPLRPVDEPDAGISSTERAVLNLLVLGLTDRAIAGQLRISERSVQRHVRTLMDLAGAHSRVQLGWYAAKHDWLPS
jgi:sugar-specific transcriptional regulator TrmB/DNA-binding CsgD family transcriptional regulator